MLTYEHMEVRGQLSGVCLSFRQDQIQADEFYPLSHPVGPQTHKTIMCVWWGAYLCHGAHVEVRGQLWSRICPSLHLGLGIGRLAQQALTSTHWAILLAYEHIFY